MAQPANPPTVADASERRRMLEETIAALATGMALLDSLGLDTAAGHVSLGLELARLEL